jgi:RHS repeat-associated protein
MNLRNSAAIFFVACVFVVSAFAQNEPNLEIGYKPYGSYSGGGIDPVNLMNGDLTLQIPLPISYPQRGGRLDHQVFLMLHGKGWQSQFYSLGDNTSGYAWSPAGTNGTLQPANTFGASVHRNLASITSGGATNYWVSGYSVVSWDGANHPLIDVSNGQQTSFEAADGSGWHVNINIPPGVTISSNGQITGGPVPRTGALIDRHGNQYNISNFGGRCSPTPLQPPISGGVHVRPIQGTGGGTRSYCNEGSVISSVTDVNGNVYASGFSGPASDTMGRAVGFGVSLGTFNPSSSPAGCGTGGPPLSGSSSTNYVGANGVTNQILFCYSSLQSQTSFGVSGVLEYPNGPFGGSQPDNVITSVVLPDNTAWKFGYDSYDNVISLGLPLGGSVAYTWANVAFPTCQGNPMSRAVTARTVTDNQGNSHTWTYQWLVQQSNPTSANGTFTNVETDPLGNDTVHVYTDFVTSCDFHETSTQIYQGSRTAGQLLKRVDTGYLTYTVGDLTTGTAVTVLPITVKTTLYPGGKVSLIQKTYDTALTDPTSGNTSYGVVVTEKEFDWGQGAPGALLRETDTSYAWQSDARYLSANLLELPASVVVRDGIGNRVAETDYAYDESQYLTAANITTQHIAPPNAVRGNLTTVSRWLNPSNTMISSHTNWYDTGEVYQQIDPLGNTTTHSYDSAYAGAYSTQTSDALGHVVSGTYDFNTGLLTSFTNANATTQASGNTPGDSAHTSNYVYDFMSRMTSATLPADAAGNHPQTTFNYPDATTVERLRKITASLTSSLTDDAFTYFDGLGRTVRTKHVTTGNALVDTAYDGLGRVATVTNPYFSTSDLTYGVTQSQYDALGRVTQVRKQDGGISTVSYSDNCTTTTDEAGKQRRACSDGAGRLMEVDEPNPGAGPSYATGSLLISGSEQSFQPATSGSGSVTISGAEQSTTVDPCADSGGSCPHTGWDTGSVSITVNGHTNSAGYGVNSTPASLAASLAAAINGDAAAAVTASASGVVVNLTGKTTGAATNYSLSASSSTNDPANFGPSFVGAPSGGTLTGGQNASSAPDTGTVTATISGTAYTVAYGAGDTASSVASRLATAISVGTYASASSSGGTVNLTSKTAGAGTNYSLAAAYAWNSGQFTQPSFTTSTSGGYLTGGYNTSDLSNNPYVTLYAYDPLGNLLTVNQKGATTDNTQWRTRTFTYDSLSRLLTANNPESGAISYFYDPNGNLTQKVLPTPNQTGTATHTISYCYDALNRVTGKAYSWQNCQNGQLPQGTVVVSYTYDQGANGIGHLTHLTDQAGSASYSYDILGRMSSEQRTILGQPGQVAGVAKTMSYTYNLDGSVATVTYPSGAVITYAPDSAGRMLSAIDSSNNINYVKNATYGPHNALTGFVSGQRSGFNGITNTMVYDVRLQPCRMTASSLGAVPTNCDNSWGELLDLRYDFHLGSDDNGNVYGITHYGHQTRNQMFTYDVLNRLTSAQNAGTDCTMILPDGHTEYWGNSYSYDAWGNLLGKSVTKCSAENLTVTAGANNQLQGGYAYDAAGNMMRDNNGTSYSYDAENRIAGAAGFAYTYDADSNRVEKANGTAGTLYWYMTPGIVSESDLAGNLKSEYVFFDGERVARKDFPSNAVSYYFSDHLKTASVITDSAGNIKSESDYYPWGGELQFTNNDSNHYKFTGKERDSESGLDYFGARYYSNGLGRFITPDWSASPVPIPYADLSNPQSLNLYNYTKNNPTTLGDTDGHCCWDWIKDKLKSFGHWLNTSPGPLIPQVTTHVVYTGYGPDGCVPCAEEAERQQMINNAAFSVMLFTPFLEDPVSSPEEVTASEEGAEAEAAELQPYGGSGGGHHVPAKSAFTGAPSYDANKALAIPNAELQRLGVQHFELVTPAQRALYTAFAKTGQKLTWDAVQKIETQALVRGGMNPNMAQQTVQKAIQGLKDAGVAGPTRIPWGGK